MTQMRPCFACHRHVRVDEDACPFCGARPSARSSGSLRRAAALALAVGGATACGPGQPAPAEPTPPVDPPAQIADAGVAAAPADAAFAAPPADAAKPEAKPDKELPDRLKMPYGAPPARQRLV